MNDKAHETIKRYLNDQITYWNGYLKRHPSTPMKKDVVEGLRRLKTLL